MPTHSDIYLLTVNYYSADFIAQLLKSVANSQTQNVKVVAVNNSPDDSAILHLQQEDVSVLEAGQNVGFGRACNLGLDWIYQRDRHAYVWLVNPDAYLKAGALDTLLKFFADYPEVSILGTIIYTPDDRIWFGGGTFSAQWGTISPLTQSPKFRTDSAYLACDWVSGCSTILNLSRFTECPQFDPAYFLYYEDFDFCQRYRAQGHTVAITDRFGVIHQPSSITNRNVFKKYSTSTFSYLLTLERYTSFPILALRVSRLLAHAIVLLLVQPSAGAGKLNGVCRYLAFRYLTSRL